jgi:hypothetical protein
MKTWVLILVTVAVLALGLLIAPRGIDALRLLAGARDEAAVAEFTLGGKRSADYAAAIDAALAAKDEDLAASLLSLADERGVDLDGRQRARVDAAQSEAAARIGQDAWNGFLTGEAPNEAALAGAVAGDLTGIGDVRDLYNQAENWLSGDEVDPLLAGLSAIGLGVTAATYASAGTALPARSGLSALKAVKRAGKLSPRLARELGGLAADALDKRAIKGLAVSLESLGTDIATIGHKAGYRATVQTLGAAQSVKEVSLMAKIAQRFGKATRGVLVLAGGALIFASVMTAATAWTVSLFAWGFAAALGLTRISWRFGRWLEARLSAQAGAGLARCVESQTIMTSASTTIGNTA